eukprot:CAMPEP_0172756804 /NCGR_PEP_ID=MMETSP1074-20121228/162480_1 /TAXON_ID=2916 /ORGANISM="Ceratium fusus, Strain PA161109" /LENGTH=35 /DNA_ID= /DNA_START= /DNA_END= /DNA_ORIENTATION=
MPTTTSAKTNRNGGRPPEEWLALFGCSEGALLVLP